MENLQSYKTYQYIFILVASCILIYLTFLVCRKHTAIIEPNFIMDIVDKIVSPIFSIFDIFLKPIIDFVNKILKFIESIPKRFYNVAMGFLHFGASFRQAFQRLGAELLGGVEGIGDGFIQSFRLLGSELEEEVIHNMGGGLKELDEVLFTDINKGVLKLIASIGKLIGDVKYVFEYVKTFFTVYLYNYVMCGINKILNFPKCVIFYIIDIIVGVFFFLPVNTLIFFLNYAFSIDVNPYYYYAMGGLECIDEQIRPFLGGYSLIHYSPSILDACYECRNLTPLPKSPVDVYVEDAEQIHKNITDIPIEINSALGKLKYGANRIPAAFVDSFELLGHQLKASLEQIGMAFPDSMKILTSQVGDVGKDMAAQFTFDKYDVHYWKNKNFGATVDVPYYYKSIKS
jgi:hypothetical protein